MRNAGLDEAQARIKIAKRNINNLRYADDTTLYYLWHLYCLLDTFLVSNDEFFSFGESTKIGEETELRCIEWPYQNTTDEVA